MNEDSFYESAEPTSFDVESASQAIYNDMLSTGSYYCEKPEDLDLSSSTSSGSKLPGILVGVGLVAAVAATSFFVVRKKKKERLLLLGETQ